MKYLFFISMISVCWLSGCSTTSALTNSWQAPGLQSPDFKKIVVIGLIPDADRSVREKMEQHIVADLKEYGYDAVCSCEEYSPKAFENLSEAEAIAKIRNSGVDAVLTITLLDKHKEKSYIPGRIMYSPYNVVQDRFYRYYRTMHERVYTAGYYVTNTSYFWESNLYDLKTDRLVYSVHSSSFDPVSTETLGHTYGKMIIKDMVKRKIISERK